MTTISALVIFAEDWLGTNANGAAEALAGAGYEVFRLPPELKAKVEIEGDDFIEVRRQVDGVDENSINATWGDDDEQHPINAMWANLKRIVAPFDADVDEVGAASREPFDGLFGARS